MNLFEETIARFQSHINYGEPDECWKYGKGIDEHYGNFRIDGKQEGAHRVAWAIENGPIPEGLSICHTYDNPSCANPSHLFSGDQSANILDAANKKRMHNARKTHCPQSHPYSKANTAIYTNTKGSHGRRCRTCNRIRGRERARAARSAQRTQNSLSTPALKTSSARQTTRLVDQRLNCPQVRKSVRADDF